MYKRQDRILETGRYQISRYPGNPLHEGLTAAARAGDGTALSNLLSTLAFLASALVFLAVARAVGARRPRWLLLIYCFLPILFVASTVTMDYVWALLCVLGAYLLLLRERYLLSAVVLGAAVGFRLGSAVLLVPMLLHLWAQGRGRRIPSYAAVCALTGLAAFSPPLLTRGPGVLSFYLSPRHELSHVPYFAAYTLGLPTSALLLVGLPARGRTMLRELKGRVPVVWTCIGAILVVGALFARIPLESEYLIPALPFLLLLVDRWSGRSYLIAFTVLSLLFGLVKIEAKDTSNLDVVRVAPHPAPGLIVEDLTGRRDQELLRTPMAPALGRLVGAESPVAVVTGFLVGCAQFRENPDLEEIHLEGVHQQRGLYAVEDSRTVLWNGPLDEAGYRELRDRGYEVVFLEGALRYSRLDSGFELGDRPARIVTQEQLLAAARLSRAQGRGTGPS